MFHKINEATAKPPSQLIIRFYNGITKAYDVAPLLKKWPSFAQLKDSSFFNKVQVDNGGYGIIWNDQVDLSCEELWANGKTIKTDFDGILSLKDASEIWDLEESTLRKAVASGKLVKGVDACKFGKQWVISTVAMRREYGNA